MNRSIKVAISIVVLFIGLYVVFAIYLVRSMQSLTKAREGQLMLSNRQFSMAKQKYTAVKNSSSFNIESPKIDYNVEP